MTSVAGGLNFDYHQDVTREETWSTYNFYVNSFEIGGLPTWKFSNDAKDPTFYGAFPLPAEAEVVLSSSSDNATPTTLTLYWGAGAHHRHSGTYQGLAGVAVIQIDWVNGTVQVTKPAGNVSDKSGGLPWAIGKNGAQQIDRKLQSLLEGHDAVAQAAVKAMTAWYTIAVQNVGWDPNANPEPTPCGGMACDVFVVKGNAGRTYVRFKLTGSGIMFSDDEEYEFIQFGLLTGDQSGQAMFSPAHHKHSEKFTPDGGVEQVDTSYSVECYAPTETRKVDKTVTKTTGSGWSVGGNVSADSGGGSDSGGSGSGTGGGASGGGAAGGAAEDAVAGVVA